VREPEAEGRFVIDVQHLTKIYGDVRAVDDLSLHVAPGEIVGLIGPNGAGKTSTLRCTVGIQAPSAGSVTIGGHDIVKAPVEAKRLLAFMADEPPLFEYLTVMEHLRLTARLYRVRDAEAKAKALLAELQLAGKEHALPAELSRGMRQKAAIACGLLHDPAALLFDEPLTGLDPLGIRHMKETIVARGRAGAAVIVSSHLLHLVEEICTRIVIIDRGVKIADATLAELRALRQAAPELFVIKSLVIGRAGGRGSEAELLEDARAAAPHVDAFLTDTFDPATGASGATGKAHDWSISRRLAEALPKPLILAGGLNPDNVAAAIAAVRPAGVDAHTGLEDAAGAKDEGKVRRFVAEARAAWAAVCGPGPGR